MRSASVHQQYTCKDDLPPGAARGAVGLGAPPGSDRQVVVHDMRHNVSMRFGPVGALLAQAGEGEGVGGHGD
jgi:hypothetical protein